MMRKRVIKTMGDRIYDEKMGKRIDEEMVDQIRIERTNRIDD